MSYVPAPLSSVSILGDGSDGALVFSTGGPTTAGATRSGTTYTMTRDIFATSIIVDAGVTLKPWGFRVFCRGLLLNNGSINADGASGGNGAAGVQALAGLGGGIQTAGSWGGVAALRADGGIGAASAAANEIGSAGKPTTAPGVGYGVGGEGGSGASEDFSAGQGLALGGLAPTAVGPSTGSIRNLLQALSGRRLDSLTAWNLFGGGGGSGGKQGVASRSGGGGGGGGPILLVARYIQNNGTISANGGNGGNGYNDTSVLGSGGGGGAGSGGVIVLVYESFSGAPATATKGTHGLDAGFSVPYALWPDPFLTSNAGSNSYTSAVAAQVPLPVLGEDAFAVVHIAHNTNPAVTGTMTGTACFSNPWTLVDEVAFNGGKNRLLVFKSTVSAAGGGGNVTFVTAGAVNMDSGVVRVFGFRSTGLAVVQHVVASGATGNAAATLAAFASANNGVLSFVAGTISSNEWTPDTNHIKLFEIANSLAPICDTMVQRANAPDTAVAATHTSNPWAIIALELSASTNTDVGSNGLIFQLTP